MLSLHAPTSPVQSMARPPALVALLAVKLVFSTSRVQPLTGAEPMHWPWPAVPVAAISQVVLRVMLSDALPALIPSQRSTAVAVTNASSLSVAPRPLD